MKGMATIINGVWRKVLPGQSLINTKDSEGVIKEVFRMLGIAE